MKNINLELRRNLNLFLISTYIYRNSFKRTNLVSIFYKLRDAYIYTSSFNLPQCPCHEWYLDLMIDMRFTSPKNVSPCSPNHVCTCCFSILMTTDNIMNMSSSLYILYIQYAIFFQIKIFLCVIGRLLMYRKCVEILQIQRIFDAASSFML